MLTSTDFLSYKECKKYTDPTEKIPITTLKSVKSTDEEMGKKFSFVHYYIENRKQRQGVQYAIRNKRGEGILDWRIRYTLI